MNKDSSFLNYSDEIIKFLNADHHDVCKFSSQENFNYQSISFLLSNFVSRYQHTDKFNAHSESSKSN